MFLHILTKTCNFTCTGSQFWVQRVNWISCWPDFEIISRFWFNCCSPRLAKCSTKPCKSTWVFEAFSTKCAILQWFLHMVCHVWHMFPKTCNFTWVLRTLLTTCAILHKCSHIFWHAFAFCTTPAMRQGSVAKFQPTCNTKFSTFSFKLAKNQRKPMLLHTTPNKNMGDPPSFTCMGALFRLRYRRDVAKNCNFTNQGKATILHTTPCKNMGDPQSYLHGNAFSITLSTRCRKKLQFYLHGIVFSKFSHAPQLHKAQANEFSQNFIKKYRITWVCYTPLTKCAILHWFLHMLWHGFLRKAISLRLSHYQQNVQILHGSCTFSDVFDTRFRKHVISAFTHY